MRGLFGLTQPIGCCGAAWPARGQRTEVEAASGNASAFPVHGTWGLRGLSAVPSCSQSRAPRQKREIVKMCWHVLTRFPPRRAKNLTPSTKNPSPARLIEHILPVGGEPIRQELPRATFRSRYAHLSGAERHRRSDSGAAVRLTRGGELGFALGRGLGCASATLEGRAGRSLPPRRPATRQARFRPRRLRPA